MIDDAMTESEKPTGFDSTAYIKALKEQQERISLGQYIMQCRHRILNPDGSDMAQTDLAEAIGVTPRTVGMWERGYATRGGSNYPVAPDDTNAAKLKTLLEERCSGFDPRRFDRLLEQHRLQHPVGGHRKSRHGRGG